MLYFGFGDAHGFTTIHLRLDGISLTAFFLWIGRIFFIPFTTKQQPVYFNSHKEHEHI